MEENTNIRDSNLDPTGAIDQKNPHMSLSELVLHSDQRNIPPIRLPEWEGFWFKAKGREFVFTKDFELLTNPDFEQYGERTDYNGVNMRSNEEAVLAHEFVRMIRRRLDAVLESVNYLLPKNRETSSAATATQLAFMWCGSLLGELGATNPYPKSMDASSPVIEKHADKTTDVVPGLEELDETAKVKSLRAELQLIQNAIGAFGQWGYTFPSTSDPQGYPPLMAIDKSIQEAKFWLGQQLNNIRIQQEESTK